MRKSSSGFTIVELLIVIVVIAILATISIVAYNGIQNRANDTAVQSDLRNVASKLEVYRVDNGRYPNYSNELLDANLKFTRGSYAVSSSSNFNLPYCTRSSATDFLLIGKSKSGKVYSMSGSGGLKDITADVTWDSSTDQGSGLCTGLGYNGAISHGYYFPDPNNAWRSWARAS